MHRNVFLTRILLALAILGAVALIVLGTILVRNRIFGSNEIRLGESAPIPQNAPVLPFKEGYVYASQMTLHWVDKNGDEKWNQALKTDDVLLGATNAAVAVYQSEELLVINPANSDRSFTKPLNLVVSQLACGQNNIALLNETRDTIYVISSAGEVVDTITRPSETILNFGFYSTNELLWIISVDASGISPVSIVSVEEPNVSTIAMKEFPDETVYNLVIDPSNASALAIGSQNVSSMDVGGGSSGSTSALVYGYTYLAHCQNTGAVLLGLTEEVNDQAVSSLRAIKDSKAVNIRLPAPCSQFLVGSQYIYAANNNAVYTLGFDGVVVSTMEFDVEYSQVRALAPSTMLLYDGQQATIATFPK